MNFKSVGSGLVQSGLLSMVGLMAISAPSQALIINGGFESDFAPDWGTRGDVSRTGTISGFAPPAGSFQALLNTGLAADGEVNYSGTAPVNSDELEDFLELAPGSLGLNAAEGSGLRQTFTTSLPGTLSFNWRFLGESSFPDLAFLVVNGNLINLAQGPGFTTGLQTYSNSAFLIAGANTIGFGIVDRGVDLAEYTGASQLLVDNVTFTAVPVPPQFAATALATALGTFSKYRRERAAKGKQNLVG